MRPVRLRGIWSIGVLMFAALVLAGCPKRPEVLRGAAPGGRRHAEPG